MSREPVTSCDIRSRKLLQPTRATICSVYLANVVEMDDLAAAGVEVLAVADLTELGDEELVGIARGLHLKHLVGVVLPEGSGGRLIEDRLIGKQATDIYLRA